MLDNSPKNSERPMSGSVVDQARDYLREGVDARSNEGRKRAVHALSREVPLSPRRVLAILHGEVKRLWADEYIAIHAWHRDFLAREAARADHRANLLRSRRETLDAQDILDCS